MHVVPSALHESGRNIARWLALVVFLLCSSPFFHFLFHRCSRVEQSEQTLEMLGKLCEVTSQLTAASNSVTVVADDSHRMTCQLTAASSIYQQNGTADSDSA